MVTCILSAMQLLNAYRHCYFMSCSGTICSGDGMVSINKLKFTLKIYIYIRLGYNTMSETTAYSSPV